MKAFRHALLIGNGSCGPAKTLKQLAQTADFILAADGGANAAVRAGVYPHAVIGDFDSVSRATRKKLPHAQWIFVDNQNNTDLQKSLDYLLEHGCKKCTLVGFGGGRVDFSLGNLLALYPYARKLDITWVGDGWKIFPVHKKKIFPARVGARVSLLPLVACSKVSLSGLKYPLKNARLSLGITRTLSNETIRPRFTVSLSGGVLLVCQED